ncbi:hypothetical protein HYZ76_01105 [Candidatus Falkowbacteria bacterium]|nr:hypothetical protein [Candidatus Falkowbacteria bacterium]
MSRRNIIIVSLALAVLILALLILFFWWLFGRTAEAEPAVNEGIQIPGILPSAGTPLPDPNDSVVGEPALEADLKAIAVTFAERFGSYSNQGGTFANLDDLSDLMTVKMKVWTESYKLEQSEDESGVYYGVTTKALTAEITSFEEDLGRAEIVVNTQRSEALVNTINPRVNYQNLVLQLVNTDNGWKVDSAAWTD